jgi:hypothetical protein
VAEETDKTSEDPASPEAPAVVKVKRGLPSGFASIRDLICFVAGLVIIANEVFFSVAIEAYAIGVGVALLGLPLVFGADERNKK